MANFVDGALQSIAQTGNRCTFLSPALLVRRLLCISADLLFFSSRTDRVSASSPILVTQSHISLSNGNRSWLTQFLLCFSFFFSFFKSKWVKEWQEPTRGRCDFCYWKRGRRQAAEKPDFQGVHQYKTFEQFCMWQWESSLSSFPRCSACSRNK